MVRIGAHLHDGDPLAEALAAGADDVQFFLGDPQGWKAPTFPGDKDPAEIRSAFAAAGVHAYIHSPYGINVASPNNRIRIPSRKLLAQQLEAAAAVGAKGLIVHGGHVTAGVEPREGYDSWRKAIERIDRPLPMLIENTAGGDGAMARSLEAIARLWDAVTAGEGDHRPHRPRALQQLAGRVRLRAGQARGPDVRHHQPVAHPRRGAGRRRHGYLRDPGSGWGHPLAPRRAGR